MGKIRNLTCSRNFSYKVNERCLQGQIETWLQQFKNLKFLRELNFANFNSQENLFPKKVDSLRVTVEIGLQPRSLDTPPHLISCIGGEWRTNIHIWYIIRQSNLQSCRIWIMKSYSISVKPHPKKTSCLWQKKLKIQCSIIILE